MSEQSSQTRRVRLTLEFSIEINENNIPDPMPGWAFGEDGHEQSERFKRLLPVLLSQKLVLDAVLLERVANHLEGFEGKWDKLLGGDLDTILAPAIVKLSELDQKNFKADENIGGTCDFAGCCFKVDLSSSEYEVVEE